MSAINIADCSGFLIAPSISIQTARPPRSQSRQAKLAGASPRIPADPPIDIAIVEWRRDGASHDAPSVFFEGDRVSYL
jgi:hypothetical protein